MPRAAQVSVRGFGHRWRGWSETLGGLGQRLFEGLGALLVLASLLLLLALLTSVRGDASLDTAVDAPPRNFLGGDGALVADLLLQSVGLAAYLVPAVLLGWAFRLMLRRPIRRPARRGALLLLALVLGAASCSILHPDLALPAGAGGALGWMLLGVVERAGFAPFALPMAMTAAALVALLMLASIGLSPGDWRDLGSGAGRGATRFARASGRGTAAAAVLGRRFVRRWREARRARRETAPDRPAPGAASRERPPQAHREHPVVTRPPARRAPPAASGPLKPIASTPS